jgi:predicted lipoprotein
MYSWKNCQRTSPDHSSTSSSSCLAILSTNNKHVAAGMLAAAGKFQLSEDNGDLVRDRVQEKEHHEFNKQLQRKDSYNALHAKVQEIENSNLPPEKWNQRQLKIMLCWYKREGDDKLPTQGARSAC